MRLLAATIKFQLFQELVLGAYNKWTYELSILVTSENIHRKNIKANFEKTHRENIKVSFRVACKSENINGLLNTYIWNLFF